MSKTWSTVVAIPRIFSVVILLVVAFRSLWTTTHKPRIIEGIFAIASDSFHDRSKARSNSNGDGEEYFEKILDATSPVGSTTNSSNFRIRKHAASACPSHSENCPRTLNVHVVPHTHDDVGWLKTIDQYYHGWNETIQQASVSDILDSVIEALSENPSRTFVYVEMKFFTMWWEEQSTITRNRVRHLIHDTKQLSFVNGGWCMHDEATTHFVGMIDQTTLGHDFLAQTLGYVPTIGWQLDPFGHSATQASLMTHSMGFDALYFGRIDYQDLELRRATKDCEGLWNAFGNNNNDIGESEDKNVFWGLTGSYGGQYGPPEGVCLDPDCGPGHYSPLVEMNRTALISFVGDFLMALRRQSDETRGDHIMVTMGEDFRYRKATSNFANLDLLLVTIARLQEAETNEEHREIDIPAIFGPEYDKVNIFYSSPEYYTRCKYNETVLGGEHHHRQHYYHNDSVAPSRELSENNPNSATKGAMQWPVKTDDFFPYSDCPNCFWTGYFSSRPSLKKFERVGSSFLLAFRQVESSLLPPNNIHNPRRNTTAAAAASSHILRSRDNNDENFDDGDDDDDDDDDDDEKFHCGMERTQLEDAMGVLQHHDGVSGTSKQHVAYDYAKRLQGGIDAILPCMIRKLKRLLLGRDNEEKHLNDLSYCQLLNETKCKISVDATRITNSVPNNTTNEPRDLYVVVYNSLASERSVVVDLPVGSNGTFLVEALGDGGAFETLVQAQPVFFRSLSSNRENDNEEPWVVSFLAASLPAVGAKVFRIRNHPVENIDAQRKVGNSSRATASTIGDQFEDENNRSGRLQKISNGRFTILVDSKTGDLKRVGSNGDVESLSSWGYYTSFDSEKDNGGTQNSGAYIFRPSSPTQELRVVPAKNTTILHNPLGTEIHTEYKEPWIQTVTKIRTGMPYLEIEYQIGPIPIGDGRGKEVVTRYNTMVDNRDGVFYTDSNGREFVRRKRNHRPTWELTVYEPTAGNYYPINTAIYVDEAGGAQEDLDCERRTPSAFAVVTDRTQGGGSILEKTVELMVHRRTLADDSRGVGEPINETIDGIEPYPPFGNMKRVGEGLIIRGKHRILVENNNGGNGSRTNSSLSTDHKNKVTCGGIGGARLARSLMDEAFAEPLVFVGTSPFFKEIPFRSESFSGLKEPLPSNVMLITKKHLYNHKEPQTYLIRLGHQYGLGEDPDLSLPVDVDLSILFPDQQIHDFQETTLSGNRAIEDWRRERLYWTKKSQDRNPYEETNRPTDKTTIVTLTAMKIRTFLVRLGE